MKNRVVFIVIASLIACALLYFIEQILNVNYETKTIFKIVFFTAIPVIYLMVFKPFSLKVERKRTFFLSILFALITFAVIWMGFFIFHSMIDFQEIHKDLQLSEDGYVLRGIYIIFGNSFLEEFFFRGFIFLNLMMLGLRKFGYIYSSALFAIYHMAMIQTWFSFWIIVLVLVSLFAVGFVFDYLCSRVASFTGSWIVHISADVAIIFIGWLVLF